MQKMPDPLLPKGRSSDAWPWILVSPWQQLSSAQVKQMSSILDQPLMGDQDYSTLAALLGYTEEQVKFFSLQRPSPTEALLKDLHTRLPVTRVNDRLLVSLGRMGAVWLSDFLRQACRVDRAQMYEDLESSVGDTLPKRAASGIYSECILFHDVTLPLACYLVSPLTSLLHLFTDFACMTRWLIYLRFSMIFFSQQAKLHCTCQVISALGKIKYIRAALKHLYEIQA